MRTLFLLNPAAGKQDCTASLIPQIEAAARRAGLAEGEYTVCVTEYAGHARELAHAAAQETAQSGEPLRIYTAGGDGTFMEAMTGVQVTGTVDDVRPYIAGSSLYIVPLRVGGGSRLKILEALAMGKTVLSTTIGAEGLHLEDGEHLLLRDNDQAFADAAVEALLNPERFAGLAAKGRDRVMELYTWDRIAGSMEAIWEATA